MGQSSLWSISWLRHQMFYPYIMISAAQARESDDLHHHTMSPSSLFLSSFLGAQRILGYVRPWRIVAVHPPERVKRRLHLEEPLKWDCLCVVLWCNWPELRHSIAASLCFGLRPRLHQGKTQIFSCGLASHLHKNPVFITENYYF